MGDLLADIGSRNSDVLLSDAVAFVEGPGDREAIKLWADTLGVSFEDRNITVLPLGGGEYPSRHLRARTEVLEGISDAAPVSHMFILDRDERSDTEVDHLTRRFAHRLHVLARREIENYMLVPRAVREAIVDKYSEVPAISESAAAATVEEVQRLIESIASELYDRLLLRRIRVELRGLRGGILTREMANELEKEAKSESLAERIQKTLSDRFSAHVRELDVASIVDQQRVSLNAEWQNVARRLEIAPGSEIIDGLFKQFGGEYAKPADTRRVAKKMLAEDIPQEIVQLVKQVVRLGEGD
jgi:hypothetical protein